MIILVLLYLVGFASVVGGIFLFVENGLPIGLVVSLLGIIVGAMGQIIFEIKKTNEDT